MTTQNFNSLEKTRYGFELFDCINEKWLILKEGIQKPYMTSVEVDSDFKKKSNNYNIAFITIIIFLCYFIFILIFALMNLKKDY